jgi:antirestriction protein ArdC
MAECHGGKVFGSEMYAAEELCAELGSAFLSAELELETESRIEKAPYAASWLTKSRARHFLINHESRIM